jgi:carbon storage regulator
MLVLTRKLMEKLYIGDDVCVTVVRLESGQVRLGIDAPRDIAVVRAELLEGRPTPPANGDSNPTTPAPMSLRTRPAEAHGIDIRRRGRSR